MDGVSMASDKLAKKASKNEEMEFDEAKVDQARSDYGKACYQKLQKNGARSW